MLAVQALYTSLRSLKGNQRACVFTEPLWAVPYNLLLPFASLYMSAIGLIDAQIGAIASLALAMELVWGLLSGAIVDRFGRRKTMLIFGLLSWTISCALWAFAQNYWFFVLAAAFNSMWRVTGNSFSCMIVEDGDMKQMVNIYTILNIMGLLAGFLSPLYGLFVERNELVPAMRGLYGLAMVLMTLKFSIQYRLSFESSMGEQRIQECKGRSILALSFGAWPAFKEALKQKHLLLCLLLMVLMTCFNTVQANFWPLFVTDKYGISDSNLSVFPMVKAVVTLLAYIMITPRINLLRVRRPLLLGFTAQGLGLITLLLLLPMGAAAKGAVFFSAACDAFALAMLGPVMESLMSLSIPSGERARINSLMFASILLISLPAGWIAGQAAQLSRVLPLIMNLCLVIGESAVALGIARVIQKEQPADPA